MNNYLKWIFSVVCGAVITFSQKYALVIIFVMVAIVFDFITGIIGAKASGEKLSSKKGTEGFWKKVSLVAALFFGFFLDYFIDYFIQYVASSLHLDIPATALFGMIFGCYIVINESISILENLQKSNPNILPAWVLKLLTSTKEQLEKEGEE